MDARNVRWSDEEFENEREKVLSLWPTGKDVDLDEAVEYHKALPDHKNYAMEVKRAKGEGLTFCQPRGGVALIDEHIKLLKTLQDEGGAELLPTTTDTYTRNMKFQEAQRGIEESRKAGRSMLNGLPVVNHGVKEVRKLVEAVDRPIMTLSGTPYPRLTSEITLAAGFTGFLGAGISYPSSYIKTMPISEGIRRFQYLDRLVSLYAERGVLIHREQPGFLTGTLIPPGVGIAIAVLEMLLAAGQGVRHYSVGLAQNLDFLQDVAALKVLEEVCHHYLDQFEIRDMFVSIATHQWMQAFPPDEARAFSVIVMGGVIAALAGATQVITKTTHEAIGIPTRQANAEGLRATRMAIQLTRGRRLAEDAEMKQEMEIIRKEARQIVDKALELGEGDAAMGAVRAIDAGTLDVPWAPNQNVKGAIIPVRDSAGAVRYLQSEDLPFDREVIQYNEEKLKSRAEKECRACDFDTAIADITELCNTC